MNSLNTQRLFIALAYRPTANVVKLLEHLQALATVPTTKLRVVAVSNLHITLKFLGMVRDTDVESLPTVMDQLISTCQPIELKLKGLGRFPNALWLGVEPSDPLQDLVTRLDKSLEVVGFPAESRVFLPHLTVARIGREGKIKNSTLQQYNETRWGSLSVAEVHLYQSKTLSAGAEYSILHSSRLEE